MEIRSLTIEGIVVGKWCSRCHLMKEASEFHISRARLDGLHDWCKPCVRAYQQSPESRARIHAYRQSPEISSHLRAYRRTREARPDVKERRRHLRLMPGRRSVKRAYQRRYRRTETFRVSRRRYQRGQRYRAYYRRYRQEHHEELKMKTRIYMRTRYRLLKTDERLRRRKDASAIISIMRRNGWIEVQPCAKCKSTERIDGHHPDYDRPLDVIWLCRPCHVLEHHPLPSNA